MLSIVWKESLKWLGIYSAFAEGGFDHFKTFKGLVAGGKKAKEMLGVVCIVVVVVSHNALSGSLGSEASSASRALWREIPLRRVVGSKVACSHCRPSGVDLFVVSSYAGMATGVYQVPSFGWCVATGV
ncbi:hypothetical protein A2U01_0019576, partial [Trifolium medium]|nr:hypothetical protein [Trifolium medium]